MVVGAGPAGMECAMAARRRGHNVTVFEKSDAIGGNFKSYATLDLANSADLLSVVRHYEVMAKKLDIEVRCNTEVNPKLMRSVLHQYDVAVVATGARIDRHLLPPCDQPGLLVDALDVAAGRVQCGHRVVILGAGKIGLVLAESLKTNGHDVTLVEFERALGIDVMPTFKWRHTAWVEELKIPALTKPDRQGVHGGRHRCERQGRRARDLRRHRDRRGYAPRAIRSFSMNWNGWSTNCTAAATPWCRAVWTQAIHDGYRLGVRI